MPPRTAGTVVIVALGCFLVFMATWAANIAFPEGPHDTIVDGVLLGCHVFKCDVNGNVITPLVRLQVPTCPPEFLCYVDAAGNVRVMPPPANANLPATPTWTAQPVRKCPESGKCA